MNIEIDIQCCRTCLESTTENYLLDNTELIQKIEITTSTEINKSDGLPLYFCSTCYNKLEVAYQFRQRSLKASKLLKDYINKVKNQFNEIFKHKSEVQEVENSLKDTKFDLSDDEQGLFEFESIETVTLQNKKKVLTLDFPLINKVENIDSDVEFNYAIDNVNQVYETLEKENDAKDILITQRLSERVKEIVRETRSSLDVKVAKVQFGSKDLVKCEKCEKVFKKENLVRHMAAHTGESRFKCHICNKNFTQKTGLNRHILIHTGERPYKCDKCGKKFSQSKSLKFHMAVHGINNSFNCTICHYKFIKAENLKIHMREKHSAGSETTSLHVCEFCKKSFKLRYSLNTHIKKYHKDELTIDMNFDDEDKETESD
ncbi:zinc finger protein 510-like [Condylostylus longicornis]|uniref:zinc finger protein 510-like n=1 Tax=Condylostylus longicornis TaxID=2530218 RepID=UPI00244DD1AC|nr:zinc finger protein 510-like [Condylostylus longicornis]